MYAIALFTLTCLGCEAEPAVPLEQALKKFSTAARIDVNVNVQSSPRREERKLDQKYSITDKKVITQLAKLIDDKFKASLLKGKYAQTTYVSVKVFAKKKDMEPAVRLTLLPKGVVVFTIDGCTFKAKQRNNELFRRFVRRDFKYVKLDPDRN